MGITGLLGAAAFWRRRHRKRTEQLRAGDGPDRAEELRAKLAESRAAETAVAPDESVPAAVTDAEASPLDPETRRKSVHDRARASIDELK